MTDEERELHEIADDGSRAYAPFTMAHIQAALEQMQEVTPSPRQITKTESNKMRELPNEIVHVGSWKIFAHIDLDGHLNMFIENKDGSPVHSCDDSPEGRDNEWTRRLTTEGIESRYSARNPIHDNGGDPIK